MPLLLRARDGDRPDIFLYWELSKSRTVIGSRRLAIGDWQLARGKGNINKNTNTDHRDRTDLTDRASLMFAYCLSPIAYCQSPISRFDGGGDVIILQRGIERWRLSSHEVFKLVLDSRQLLLEFVVHRDLLGSGGQVAASAA